MANWLEVSQVTVWAKEEPATTTMLASAICLSFIRAPKETKIERNFGCPRMTARTPWACHPVAPWCPALLANQRLVDHVDLLRRIVQVEFETNLMN
jgi:hypothetical protein